MPKSEFMQILISGTLNELHNYLNMLHHSHFPIQINLHRYTFVKIITGSDKKFF